MEYLMVGLALLGLAVKGYCGKKISGFVQTPADAVGWNLIRMLLCMLIGACLFFFEQAQDFLLVEPGMLAICLLSGLANATFLVLWVFAVQKNTMVFVDVGLTMGSMITAVLCAFLFREVISIPKLLGFALILLATVVLAGPHGHLGRVELSGISLVGLAAIADGLSGFAQQLYRQYYTANDVAWSGIEYPKSVFHFYTYAFAVLAFVLVLWVLHCLMVRASKDCTKGEEQPRRRVPTSVLVYIFVMAVCLFAANYFQTVATNDYHLPSQVLYPVIKGGCLITVNITAMLFFGEPITKRSLFGSMLALVGIVAMSIL